MPGLRGRRLEAGCQQLHRLTVHDGWECMAHQTQLGASTAGTCGCQAAEGKCVP
jgi:hypothetical protein